MREYVLARVTLGLVVVVYFALLHARRRARLVSLRVDKRTVVRRAHALAGEAR